MNNLKISICSACLAGTALYAVPAYAQETPAAEEAYKDSGLGDIVVTARRRSETSQSTPLAITAMSQQRLEEARITEVTALSNLTPALQVVRNSTNPGAIFAFIRGFGTKSTDPGVETPIAITVDGIYLGTLVGSFVNLADVESVEVLKGPQGTLLGKNAPAGGIAVRTRRPGDEFGGLAQVDYGSFKDIKVFGYVDVPVVADKLLVTASAFYEHSDGYVKNTNTNTYTGGIDMQSYRLGVLANVSEDVTWYVTAQIDMDKGEDAGDRNISDNSPLVIPTAAYPVVAPTKSLTCTVPFSSGLCGTTLPNTKRYTTQGRDGPNRNMRTISLTSNLDADAGPVNFTVVTGYRNFRERGFADIDGTPLAIIDSDYDGTYRQFSNEVRVASSDGGGLDMDGRLNWLIGAYYYNLSYDRLQPLVILGNAQKQYQEGTTNSYALFAHSEFKLLDNLTVSGGIRQTWDARTHMSRSPSYFAGTQPEFSQRASWDNFSYDATLQYSMAPSNMVYLRYATGYRGGGFTGVPSSALAVSIVDPETVKAWELGTKNDFFDHRLRVNLNIFHSKYSNLQRNITIPTVESPFFVQKPRNVASAVTKGVEGEILARPIPELTLRGSFGYLDAKYTDFTANLTSSLANGETDNRALKIAHVPKWTWQTGATYDVELGDAGKVSLSVDYSYRSGYNVTDLNFAGFDQKGFGLLSGSITWRDRDDRFAVSVYGKNLTDKFYIDGGDAIGGLSSYVSDGPPRQIGASIRARF